MQLKMKSCYCYVSQWEGFAQQERNPVGVSGDAVVGGGDDGAGPAANRLNSQQGKRTMWFSS